jgi:hypothetical protein
VASLVVEEVEELTVEDFATAEAEPGRATIAALRQSHHVLARLIAKGTLTMTEISSITGYSLSRISILKADPTFKELVSSYSAMEAEGHKIATADMYVRLASLGFDAVETLHERLVDRPETLDNKTLLAIVEASSDRTGYGKQSTVNSNVNHSVSSETLARIRSAVDTGVAVAEKDRGALVGLAARLTAVEHSDAEEADGSESPGEGLREESEPETGSEALGDDGGTSEA